jgi:cellobiose epimerase
MMRGIGETQKETAESAGMLRERVERELRGDILPFWLERTIDEKHGGFRGQIANDLTIDEKANKGLILNARILWTFAKAYKFYRDEQYLRTAQRAYRYLIEHFWDEELGGLYWMVDYEGNPVDTKKRIYGQAFAVYTLTEYAGASGEKEPRNKAIELYQLIEDAAHDVQHGGYFETYARDWALAEDQRLSEADMDEKKSMNTHLHLLEAYANLLRVWNDNGLRSQLRELVRVFLDHIIDRTTHHFRMFFDEAWHDRSDRFSFGHDIEGSWLLCEAAEVLGDRAILEEVRKEAVMMAQTVYEQAIDRDGGLLYEGNGREIIDSDKHWWPQAEAVVGFLNAYELSGKEHFLRTAERSWEFIEKTIVDGERGEWYWMVSRNGTPNDEKEKVGPWKCPYHNSRMCFEVMERVDKLVQQHAV